MLLRLLALLKLLHRLLLCLLALDEAEGLLQISIGGGDLAQPVERAGGGEGVRWRQQLLLLLPAPEEGAE
jgi:hypothetical protein